MLAQYIGAFVGAAVVYLVYYGKILKLKIILTLFYINIYLQLIDFLWSFGFTLCLFTLISRQTLKKLTAMRTALILCVCMYVVCVYICVCVLFNVVTQ